MPFVKTTIKVVAKSNRGVFVGVDSDGEYCVFSLDDNRDIVLEDKLDGNFDDSDGLFKAVRNVTQGHGVRICAETWSCTKTVAFDFLRRLSSPTKIWTI